MIVNQRNNESYGPHSAMSVGQVKGNGPPTVAGLIYALFFPDLDMSRIANCAMCITSLRCWTWAGGGRAGNEAA